MWRPRCRKGLQTHKPEGHDSNRPCAIANCAEIGGASTCTGPFLGDRDLAHEISRVAPRRVLRPCFIQSQRRLAPEWFVAGRRSRPSHTNQGALPTQTPANPHALWITSSTAEV